MIDKARLTEKCRGLGIPLTPGQADLLDEYARILVEYNEKVNLTAITDPEGIEDRHLVDSLLFASQPEVAGSLVDVGTGAGFPGIVAKIYRPELALTLSDLQESSRQLAQGFEQMSRELGRISRSMGDQDRRSREVQA